MTLTDDVSNGSRLMLGGWMAVNTDACYNSGSKLAGSGGVMRNTNGAWIEGFRLSAA